MPAPPDTKSKTRANIIDLRETQKCGCSSKTYLSFSLLLFSLIFPPSFPSLNPSLERVKLPPQTNPLNPYFFPVLSSLYTPFPSHFSPPNPSFPSLSFSPATPLYPIPLLCYIIYTGLMWVWASANKHVITLLLACGKTFGVITVGRVMFYQ